MSVPTLVSRSTLDQSSPCMTALCGSVSLAIHGKKQELLVACNRTYYIGKDHFLCDFKPLAPNQNLSIDDVHCKLWADLTGDSYVVRIQDHGSREGTFVDGERLKAWEVIELSGERSLSFGGVPPAQYAYTFRGFQPGSIFTFYNFSESLGAGSYGKVHRVVHRISGRVYAAKHVRIKAIPRAYQRMAREIDAMVAVQHEHIVCLWEVFNERTDIYFVMEIAPFGNVSQLMLEHWGLHERQAKQVTIDVCSALVYMHDELNMIHRDVKPENLLVFSLDPLVVKLADFGVSKVLNGGTMCQTYCGTAAYMAPEVIAAQTASHESYGYKVDAWSLGVLVFEMLAYALPFKQIGDNMPFCRLDHSTVHWEYIRDDVSQLARNFISHLLIIDVACRKAVQDITVHDWLK